MIIIIKIFMMTIMNIMMKMIMMKIMKFNNRIIISNN